jgi:hypothetical protein
MKFNTSGSRSRLVVKLLPATQVRTLAAKPRALQASRARLVKEVACLTLTPSMQARAEALAADAALAREADFLAKYRNPRT